MKVRWRFRKDRRAASLFCAGYLAEVYRHNGRWGGKVYSFHKKPKEYRHRYRKVETIMQLMVNYIYNKLGADVAYLNNALGDLELLEYPESD